MARRSRSLSELPGHLRVPILKRKDTERTQARLQAGLAGMEELRVLREHQQQLIGDTMARVEDRHQRLHPISRRHSVDGLMTSGRPKRSAVQQSPSSHHDVISSWQSATSLASISEEGDAMASRDTRSNENRLNDGYRDKKLRDNHNSSDNTSKLDGNCKGIDVSPCKRQLVRSKSYLEETPRSWRSQESIYQQPKPNAHQRSSTAFQSSNEYGSRKVRRSMSLSLSSSSAHNLPNGNALSNYRRNSTSMIHDLPSGDLSRSYSSHNLYPKGKRHAENLHRYPLSSISNTHMPTAAGESTHPYGQNCAPSSPDRNCGQISWDNLLKTIGISSSTTSLTSLVEDENSDKIDDVFDSVQEQDEVDDNFETQPPLPDQHPRLKMGRSFSFCHGNTATNSRNYSQLIFQGRRGSSFDDEENTVSSQMYANTRQNFQPIMRRASMQCEAVLTKSGMSKRRVNPIQDVDISTLTNPGPVHAVMLQYTSPKVGATLSNSTNGPNTVSSGRKMSDSKDVIQSKMSESEHKYLKMSCRDKGNECELVKTGTEFQELRSRANECENENDRSHSFNGDHPMNIAEFAEHGVSEKQDIERHSPELKNKSQVCKNTERRNSTDGIAKMEVTPPLSVKDPCVRSSCGDRLNETIVTAADSFSKTDYNSIDYATTKDGDCVKVVIQNPNLLQMEESSNKESNLDEPQKASDQCLRETCSLVVGEGSSKNFHYLDSELNGHQTNNHSHQKPSHSVVCSLVHPRNVEKTASKVNSVGKALASNSAQADTGINDSEDSHVMRYCQGDVSKISSDLSVISDEGYCTSESVVSTARPCRENELNSLDSSSVSEPISSVIEDTFDTTKSEQELMPESRVGEGNTNERSNLTHPLKEHGHSVQKECRYDDVAVLEPGLALVWNPEPCKNPTKSLHRRVFAYKSLKQTAV